jgi:deoxyribonuclease-2
MFVAGLLFWLAAAAVAASLSCRRDDGTPVSWWVAFKAPAGTTYWIADAERPLTPSSYSLNDTEHGALASTLRPLWDPSITAYGIFNDEVPGHSTTLTRFGHTKGLFAINDDGAGLWLTHSIPQFPLGPGNVSSYEGLGANAGTYGQSLICVSAPGSTINAMAGLALLNRPQIYDGLVSDAAAALYPNVSAILHGHYSTEPRCVVEELPGTQLFMVAKSREWGKDLYSDCVSPTWSTSLWVESWIRGSAFGPTCPTDGLDTLDVTNVRWGAGMEWSSGNDHSKWTVALNVSLICVGDINRMTTQEARGGGTICLTDVGLVEAARAAVVAVGSCPGDFLGGE